MRKIIIFVLVVMLAGGYTAYWFKKANDFKLMMEQSITTLNEQGKRLNKNLTLVRYDSIEVSGFPFAMTLEVVKPVIDVPVSELLRRVPQAAGMMAKTPDGAAVATPAGALGAPTQWLEEIAYGDRISFSANLTGRRFILIARGNRTETSFVDNIPRHVMEGNSSTPLVCHLDIADNGNPAWTMQPVFTDLATFLSVFRGMDCQMKGLSLKDARDGSPLMAADEFYIASGNEPSGNNHKLFFKFNVKNAIAYPAYDPLYADYTALADGFLGKPGAAPTHTAMQTLVSEYGAQNLTVDLAYDGPVDKTGWTAADMHFKYDINSLNLQNALFSSQLEAHIGSAIEGDDRTALLTLHSNLEASDRYDAFLRQQFLAVLNDMKQRMAASNDPRQVQMATQFGTPDEIANAVLPKFHPLGKINLDIDINGRGKKEDVLTHSSLTVNALNLVATPFGLQIKGTISLTEKGKSPSVDLSATCISCDALITTLGNYLMRVEAIAVKASQPPKPAIISDKLIAGVKDFVRGISENASDPNAKDWVIHAVMKNTGEFTVSGKQVLEILGLYTTTIAPYLQPQPAAAPAALSPDETK